jgi:hypothetical protein
MGVKREVLADKVVQSGPEKRVGERINHKDHHE